MIGAVGRGRGTERQSSCSSRYYECAPLDMPLRGGDAAQGRPSVPARERAAAAYRLLPVTPAP
jgi:hypothetical protein